MDEAGPATPVEVLGLNGTPLAGDDFTVVENEGRAREIAEYRQRSRREKEFAATGRGTLEQMMSRIQEGEAAELPVVVKIGKASGRERGCQYVKNQVAASALKKK